MVNSFFYRICEWIMRFALLNFLWISFTLLGFIVLGFFPATVAMFTVVRKWIMKQSDIAIWKTFFTSYKSEWLRSNLFGIIILGLGGIIYLEFTVIKDTNDLLLQVSKYPLFLLFLLFCVLLLYGFPTYVHYRVRLYQVFKNSLLVSLINPFFTIVMVLGLALIYLLVKILPPLLLFFGGSASAYFIMWCCYQAFLNVQARKDKLSTSVDN
ncbi:DUF624 domain-containing protein [Anaerobacillus alkaliphilus]|uniref:DUF624 domain-containing protein n=1 Tax=Anaerobacillus alkaliphilus TaxID=1548597 RepID=A0A4Q0VV58_9BACI|nr:YesL family protein [Anaerobacillus alkaliphilus]RXJ02571.1 DUF624 domain-containing protein [Anaerobacillus alkaliphilus]